MSTALNNEDVKVAIAGAGLMGYWHAYYAKQRGARVCGILDPDQTRASELAGRFKGAASFQTLDRMPEECVPRAIHICTPTHVHEALIDQALDRGLHVMVEKPMVATAATTARLLRKAETSGCLVVPTHQFIFQPAICGTRAFLARESGPTQVDFVINSAGAERLEHPDLDQLAADILPHPLSLIANLFPAGLAAIQWSLAKMRPGEWLLTGTMSDAAFTIRIGFLARPTECSMRIRTARGTFHHDFFHGLAFYENERPSKRNKILRPFRGSLAQARSAVSNLSRRVWERELAYPGLGTLIEDFYLAIRHGAEKPLSDADILDVARARDSIVALL